VGGKPNEAAHPSGGDHEHVSAVERRPGRWLTGALLFGGGVAVGALAFAGNSSSDGASREVEPPLTTVAPPSAITMAEYFIETDAGILFERVDRATPMPIGALIAQTCFSNPGWRFNGAPYDRGELLASLPVETLQGAVNAEHQCDVFKRRDR
jgi:hypothetical protein